MFYEKFLRLCEEKGVSPTAACMDMHISDGSWRRWRDGSSPRGATIKKIGEYFNVSPSVLLNDSDDIEYIPEEDEKRIARQMAFDRSEMRTLFDLAVNAPASQIYEAITLLQKYKEDSEGK